MVPIRTDPTGLVGPTPGQARGPHWRRTGQGFYVPAHVEPSTDQRIVEAAAVLRNGEAVTGWAALHWMGAAWFDGAAGPTSLRDVPLLARRDRAAPTGAAVSQEFLHPDEITTIDGVPVTSAVRSVVHEMRFARTLGDAIVALDMACYSDLVSLGEVAAYVGALGPVTGVQQARDALAHGEENSWSPQETRMRGVWKGWTDIEHPLCNRPVFSLGGRHVGTPDLVAPALGLVGQYNGSDHLSLAAAAADTKKDAAYRDLGLETVTMLATDWNDVGDFLERLEAAAGRAAERTGTPLWTLDEPAWWTPTHTVELRRGLRGPSRQRLLRYRRTA